MSLGSDANNECVQLEPDEAERTLKRFRKPLKTLERGPESYGKTQRISDDLREARKLMQVFEFTFRL